MRLKYVVCPGQVLSYPADDFKQYFEEVYTGNYVV